MNFKTSFLGILFLYATACAFAQGDSLNKALSKLNTTTNKTKAEVLTSQNPGRVVIFADSSIISLEKSTRRYKETKGYRIQIFLGTLEQTKNERNKYLSQGLPYSAYLKQVVPEHALQIGDFTNRMEMEKNLEIIRKYYPKAFGVVEFIEPPKFNSKK